MDDRCLRPALIVGVLNLLSLSMFAADKDEEVAAAELHADEQSEQTLSTGKPQNRAVNKATKHACQNCRARHTKCSDEKPCASCKKKSLTCVTSQREPRTSARHSAQKKERLSHKCLPLSKPNKQWEFTMKDVHTITWTFVNEDGKSSPEGALNVSEESDEEMEVVLTSKPKPIAKAPLPHYIEPKHELPGFRVIPDPQTPTQLTNINLNDQEMSWWTAAPSQGEVYNFGEAPMESLSPTYRMPKNDTQNEQGAPQESAFQVVEDLALVLGFDFGDEFFPCITAINK